MILVSTAESGDGAIVDISDSDYGVLSSTAGLVFGVVGDVETKPQTGYTGHAYRQLIVWMAENRPNFSNLNNGQLSAMAQLRSRAGLPTDSEGHLVTKIGDIDTSTVRWKFNLEALLMFDVAVREVITHFSANPARVEGLPTRTGLSIDDFRALQQEITDILEAVDLAAQQGEPIK